MKCVICHVYSESEMQTNVETHARKNSQHLRGCHSISWLSYSEIYWIVAESCTSCSVEQLWDKFTAIEFLQGCIHLSTRQSKIMVNNMSYKQRNGKQKLLITERAGDLDKILYHNIMIFLSSSHLALATLKITVSMTVISTSALISLKSDDEFFTSYAQNSYKFLFAFNSADNFYEILGRDTQVPVADEYCMESNTMQLNVLPLQSFNPLQPSFDSSDATLVLTDQSFNELGYYESTYLFKLKLK
uniref:Uncharacterized protein n=1 Tax=Glossina austeni TaxID=7395 RepID=A0A1A9UZ55_GLOAU